MQSIGDLVKYDQLRLTLVLIAERTLFHSTWDILPDVLLVNALDNFPIMKLSVRNLVGFLDSSFFDLC